MVGFSFSKRGMTIFVSRCISGADGFSAYACQNVIVVVAADRSPPALAAVTATLAAATATTRNLTNRISSYLLKDADGRRTERRVRTRNDKLRRPPPSAGCSVGPRPAARRTTRARRASL